jgi:hypothetical protein
MDPEVKRLYGEIGLLNQQIGWLMGTLKGIATGETLGREPADHARVSLDLFVEHYKA